MPDPRRHALQVQLGAQLRVLRRRAGLSTTQLAERLPYSQSKVSRIEAGKLWPPTPDIVAYLDAVGAKGKDRAQVIALAETIDYGPTAWPS